MGLPIGSQKGLEEFAKSLLFLYCPGPTILQLQVDPGHSFSAHVHLSSAPLSRRLWRWSCVMCTQLPKTVDLLASCRGLGGRLSPLALVKWLPPLCPSPAATPLTARAGFMTRIHQIRKERMWLFFFFHCVQNVVGQHYRPL